MFGNISLSLFLSQKLHMNIRKKFVFQQATVKPALSDHPTVQEKVVVIDRWSLKQGSLNSGRFSKLCWTVANVVERMRTINATISHVDRVQAVASCGGSLANLRCGGYFKRECGVKARPFSCFWSLKTGKILPLVQKIRVAGRVAQVVA